MNNCIRKWIFGIVAACLELIPLQAHAEQLKVGVASEAAILINTETGHVLFEKNADQVLFPASITKVATGLYILEKFGNRLQEQACAKHSALAWAAVHLKRNQPARYPSYLLESKATHMGLQVGEKIPVGALLEALLIWSANDAANVLAEHVSGSVPKFMKELNDYLAFKGFKHTHFDNPHGLHHTEHQTTARDMAGIAREAMKFPLFRTIVRQEKAIRPQTNKQAALAYGQHNLLLRRDRRYFYPHATGIKNGYESKSKFTLIGSARHENRDVIAVLLGCPTNDQLYRDATALFEAAFAEKKLSRLLLTKDYDTFTLGIKGAKQQLKACMAGDLILDYYPSEEPIAHTAVDWNVRHLPIQEGQTVGSIALIDQNNVILKKMPLLAMERVDPTLLWKTRHYAALIAKMKLTKVVLLAMIFVSAIAGWIYFRSRNGINE